MATETIDHNTLSRLVEAGAVRGAHVVGQSGGWAVVVHYGVLERHLAAQRSRQVRLFRKLETLVGYLKEIGIAKFDVDAAEFDPSSLKTRARPDSSAALKSAHEAAAHDKWFRAEVEKSLLEADDPATVWTSNRDAKARFAKKRAELASRVKA